MKVKQNLKIIGIIACVFCVLYTMLATKPLTKEMSFKPEWTINIIAPDEHTNGNGIPFKLGQTLGYFTSRGDIATLVNFSVKGTITDKYYTYYGYDSSSFEVFDNTAHKISVINKTGYPFFQEDRMYVFMPSGCSVMQVNSEGNELWRFENYSPITAFNSSNAGTILGFADGNIYTFNIDGLNDISYSPGGSKYPVILGVAISNDGNYTACVSGHEKQRFVLSRKTNGTTRTVFHEYLPNDELNQVLVKFSNDNNYVFYNYKDGLGMHRLSDNKTGHLVIKGTIIDIQESAIQGLIFVLSKDNNTYTVSAVEPMSSLAASFSFDAKNAFIRTQENALFIGRDNQISKINIDRN